MSDIRWSELIRKRNLGRATEAERRELEEIERNALAELELDMRFPKPDVRIMGCTKTG